MTASNEYDFKSELFLRIKEKNFDSFTSTQKSIFPIINSNLDHFFVVSYGNGKTASFVIPIVNKLDRHEALYARVLIVTPGDYLNHKIQKYFQLYCDLYQLYCKVVDDSNLNIESADIVICSIKNLELINIDYTKLNYVVLDEIDIIIASKQESIVERIWPKLEHAQKIIFANHTSTQINDFVKNNLAVNQQTQLESDLIDIKSFKHSFILTSSQSKSLEAYLLSDFVKKTIIFTQDKGTTDLVCDVLRNIKKIPFRVFNTQQKNDYSDSLLKFLSGKTAIAVVQGYAPELVQSAQLIISVWTDLNAEIYKSRINCLSNRSKHFKNAQVLNVLNSWQKTEAEDLCESLNIQFERSEFSSDVVVINTKITNNNINNVNGNINTIAEVTEELSFGRPKKNKIRR